MSSTECINYWESCLQDISLRSRHVDATVLLVGNKGVGKTSLLSGFCEAISNRPSNELICYDYYSIYDNEDAESTAKVNVWSFDEKTFPAFVDIYFKPSSDDKKVCQLFLV
jgi:ABC-type cobalamin/Fe3+-siderophores transport system ATPase subunit